MKIGLARVIVLVCALALFSAHRTDVIPKDRSPASSLATFVEMKQPPSPPRAKDPAARFSVKTR